MEIKFWCYVGKEYVPSPWDTDFAINKDGKVVRINTDDVMYHLEAHIFVNGERRA